MSTLLPEHENGSEKGYDVEVDIKHGGKAGSEIEYNEATKDLSLATPTSDRPFKFFWQRMRAPQVDLDNIATQPSVFDDLTTLETYRPPPAYENAHRFDPRARWTWREERVCIQHSLLRREKKDRADGVIVFQKVVRKIDVRIMIWACV